MMKKQTCKRCFRKTRFEFSVKDEIWNKLPEKWQDHALCIECFLEELEMACPDQEFNTSDFAFLGIVGDLENDEFGGILVDTVDVEP